MTEFTVEEPESGSVPINLPVIRNAGTLGNVTVEWVATIGGHPADEDLQVASGNITFAPGEAFQMLLLEILADDVPEIEEVSQALTSSLKMVLILTCSRNMYDGKQEMFRQEGAIISCYTLLVIIVRKTTNCLAALLLFLFFSLRLSV